MNKKKRASGLIVILAAAVICVLGIAFWKLKGTDKLSEEEIMELRERYPEITVEKFISWGIADLMPREHRELDADTHFVYGQVIGEETLYYRNSNTGEEFTLEEYEKLTYGKSAIEEMYAYTFSVLQDTKELFRAGEQITITGKTAMRVTKPELWDGIQLVISIHEEGNFPDGTYGWSAADGFYVTEDGYALTIGEEALSLTYEYNGLKVEDLMEALEKLG